MRERERESVVERGRITAQRPRERKRRLGKRGKESTVLIKEGGRVKRASRGKTGSGGKSVLLK